jgi:hypothetical protein
LAGFVVYPALYGLITESQCGVLSAVIEFAFGDRAREPRRVSKPLTVT